jgi:cell division protein FtsB
VLRLLTLLLLAALIALQVKLWSGSGGRTEVEALKAAVAQQEAENAALRQRNAALVAEVEDLKSGTAAVEERARTELGMIRPGETYYRIVEHAPGVVEPTP